MPRETNQLLGEQNGPADHWIGRVEPGLADLIWIDGAAPTTPDRSGEGGGYIFGQAERLADLPHGRARSIGNHRGGQGRLVSAIAIVDILNDFLAALMFKIDIDIRWLFAFL